jgi:adenylate cyclase
MQDDYLILNSGCLAATVTAPDKETELAILFLDIRNFTGLMEAHSGQSVIQTMRRLFTAFNQIIKSFQGKVVEIAGDNLYAVFGLQTNLNEAVNYAYQATKMMFHTLNLFNEANAVYDNDSALQMGVGLHAGKVFVGEFGLDAPAQLSVMGLPVNIAARLQAKTKELNNDLLISEDAYRLLEPNGTVLDQRTVNLQGISQGQQVRLAGKPYNNNRFLGNSKHELDYLLAISG